MVFAYYCAHYHALYSPKKFSGTSALLSVLFLYSNYVDSINMKRGTSIGLLVDRNV